MFDIYSNHKVCKMRDYAQQEIGAANQPADAGVDMQEVASKGLRERTTRGLLLIEVGAVGAGGTLDIIVQDIATRVDPDLKNPNLNVDPGVWDVDFCTLLQITAIGDYMYDLKGFNQKIRLNATVAVGAISWSSTLIGFDATRRPVKQTDFTKLTGTFGTGR